MKIDYHSSAIDGLLPIEDMFDKLATRFLQICLLNTFLN